MTYEEQYSDIKKHFLYRTTKNTPKEIEEINDCFLKFSTKLGNMLTTDPETLVCLRKLLEAKDAALRTARKKGHS